jgi:hypothetical protein
MEIYYSVFSTQSGNQNCHAEDIFGHTGLLFHKLPTQGMMYPEICFGQTLLLLPVETLFLISLDLWKTTTLGTNILYTVLLPSAG